MYAVWKRFYIVGIRGIHLQKESERAEAGCTEVSLVHFLFCRCFMVNFPSHDFEQPQILTGVNTVCLFAHTNTCTEKHTHICMHKISITPHTPHNINKNTTVHTYTNTKKYTNLFLWPTHTHLTGSFASHSCRIHLHAHPRLTCQFNNSYVLYTQVTNHNRCESQDNTEPQAQ